MTEPAPADSNMMFRLMVPRTSKENQKNGQESIEFAYNLQTDVPEDVVNDMVRERERRRNINDIHYCTCTVYTCIHVHVHVSVQYMQCFIYLLFLYRLNQEY